MEIGFIQRSIVLNFKSISEDILRSISIYHTWKCFVISWIVYFVVRDISKLLIHLGYLAYDSREEAFIPNKEIIGEFENAMSVSGWPEIMRILKASDKLLKDTLNGDESRVAEGLDRAHTEAASILTYNDEIRWRVRLALHITAQGKITGS